MSIFANIEDPAEMQHDAAFHQGLYCFTPTKRSDAQPLVEREKHFKCLPVEISRS